MLVWGSDGEYAYLLRRNFMISMKIVNVAKKMFVQVLLTHFHVEIKKESVERLVKILKLAKMLKNVNMKKQVANAAYLRLA